MENEVLGGGFEITQLRDSGSNGFLVQCWDSRLQRHKDMQNTEKCSKALRNTALRPSTVVSVDNGPHSER